jgi:hypothetical protein
MPRRRRAVLGPQLLAPMPSRPAVMSLAGLGGSIVVDQMAVELIGVIELALRSEGRRRATASAELGDPAIIGPEAPAKDRARAYTIAVAVPWPARLVQDDVQANEIGCPRVLWGMPAARDSALSTVMGPQRDGRSREHGVSLAYRVRLGVPTSA